MKNERKKGVENGIESRGKEENEYTTIARHYRVVELAGVTVFSVTDSLILS